MLKMEAEDWEFMEEPMVQITSIIRFFFLSFFSFGKDLGLNPGSPLTIYGTFQSHLIPPNSISPSVKIIFAVLNGCELVKHHTHGLTHIHTCSHTQAVINV